MTCVGNAWAMLVVDSSTLGENAEGHTPDHLHDPLVHPKPTVQVGCPEAHGTEFSQRAPRYP